MHYPKAKLAELYQLRWQGAEVNLKPVKTPLKMEMLAAKTPAMVRKALWVHMMAYSRPKNYPLMQQSRPILKRKPAT
ncbi:hypothetical protein [Synechococcus sp. PCC 7336]|uniref:hypothetical protein n=1 Tax=Synechococcus sp. PCC 7336 TaxID=195250 RepID=UPI0003468543|nr:hypothetical protein [Synechococcus sp. PCC 7336]